MRTWGAVAIVWMSAGLVIACSGSEKSGSEKRDWICFESSECDCRVQKPNTVSGGSNRVESCLIDSCCLLTQSSSGDVNATCECLESDDCAAEASSRRSTEVVSQCPPPGEAMEAPAGKCASDGENCRPDYLKQNELSGCCDGSLCKANAAGIPVCQAASEDELGFFEQCQRAERSEDLDTLELVSGTLGTSVGEITLDPTVQFPRVAVGPAGCVNAMSVTIGAPFDCRLELEIELGDEALRLASLRGDLSGCEGFSGERGFITTSEAPLPGDVSIQTAACDGGLVFESYCVAGRFDFHLDGTIGGVTFNDVHVILEGGSCSAEPEGECPGQ